jgi:hypothetical protein
LDEGGKSQQAARGCGLQWKLSATTDTLSLLYFSKVFFRSFILIHYSTLINTNDASHVQLVYYNEKNSNCWEEKMNKLCNRYDILLGLKFT